MQRIKNKPRAQEILEDAGFQQKIQSGNPIDLLTNAKLLELADMIFAENFLSQTSSQPNPSIPTTTSNKANQHLNA